MEIVIVHRPTRVVAGIVSPERVDEELQNLLKSELGGLLSDYRVVTPLAQRGPRQRYRVNPDETVSVETVPDNADTTRIKELRAKNRALWTLDESRELLQLLARQVI